MAQTRKKLKVFHHRNFTVQIKIHQHLAPVHLPSLAHLFSVPAAEEAKKNKQATFVRSPSDWGKCPFFPTQRQMEVKVYQTQLSTEQWKIEICDRKVQSSSGSSKKAITAPRKLIQMRGGFFYARIWQQAGQKATTADLRTWWAFWNVTFNKLQLQWRNNQKQDRSIFLTAVQR